MARGLFVIVIAFLAAGSPSVCIAHDRAMGDSSELTRQEWQSRVNATRQRLEQQREKLRLEREKRLEPKREVLRLDRENRLGAKQEELRLDREKRIEPNGTTCSAGAKNKKIRGASISGKRCSRLVEYKVVVEEVGSEGL